MTAPINVGQVQVEVLASARALAKSLKKEVESAFKDLDLRSAIRNAVGKAKVTVPVDLDPDTDSVGEKVRRTRVPKVPVELDPVLQAFQQEIRRQTAALGRQLNVNIPVGADTGGLREQLGAQLQAVKQASRIEVPTEPGAKAEYEARLKAQLAEVAARVRQHVKVDVDVDRGGSAALSAIGGLIKGFGKGLPNLGGIASGISSLGSSLQKAAGSSAQLGGNLAGAMSSASGPIGLVVGLLTTAAAAMAALGTAAILVVPAMTAVAGAAAAIPAALAGAGAAIGTLALGFKGIGAAFKPKTVGGGGGSGSDPESQARRVAAAERGVEGARRGIAAATRALQSAERGYDDAVRSVADAQRRALQAQQAVNRARVEAREDIDDLNRSLRGARLSEEDAALGVTEALRALNEVRLTGNIPDIQRADLAYRQALQTLDEAKDTTEDLQSSTDDANSKGVEGSDKVQSALQDQQEALRGVEDAQRGVLDAQNAIASAQDGLKSANDSYLSSLDSLAEAQKKVAAGGGGVAAEVVKLAPAAQKFVDAIKALKPAFESLRLDVQQRLFQGLDKTVTRIGETWIPALRVTLGRYADTFNQFFRSLGTSITTPKFIADIQAGAEGARQGLAAIGSSITTSLVPALGALSRAAGPFLTQLGKEIADIVTQFSNWVLEGEKTGGLASFFTKASEALHDIFTTGKLVTKIVGQIFQAIIGPGASKATAIDSFNAGLQQISNWLARPENQQGIHDFIVGLGSALIGFLNTVNRVSGWLERAFPPSDKDRSSSIGSDIGRFLVAGLIAGIGEAMKASMAAFLKASVFGFIVDTIKALFGIKSPSTVMAAIGRDVIAGLINGIGSLAGTLASRVAGLRTTIVNQLANAGSLLIGAGRNVVAGLANGITSLYGALGSRAAGLRTTISNQLVNAGNLLYSAGRAVIDGLKRGIDSALPGLGTFLSGVGRFIQDHKGPLDADRKLLVGAGQAIMGGLIGGIAGEKAALAAELADVTSLVALTSVPSLDVNADAAITRSLTAASSATLQAQWAQGATGDPILDGLRKLIEFKYRGSSNLALDSA